MSDVPDGKGLIADLILSPEWAARVGLDKTFYDSGTSKTWAQYISEDYVVPAGKTLYISGASFHISSTTDTDYDHLLHFYAQLKETLLLEINTLVALGGEGGDSLVFPRPLVIDAGWKLTIDLFNYSNITCTLRFTVWGFEL